MKPNRREDLRKIIHFLKKSESIFEELISHQEDLVLKRIIDNKGDQRQLLFPFNDN